MSTMESHTASLPSKLFSLPYTALTATASFLVALSESFDEALKLAHEAERRYPFANW